MKKAMFAGAAIFASVIALCMPVSAQVVGIATDQPGSLGFNTGQAVAKVLSLQSDLKVRTQPMAGTAAYLPLINRGEMDFGFCNATEAYYAQSGTGNFAGKPNPNLRMVGMMFPLRTGLAVVADTGIKTIHDLAAHKGKLRIASEYKASNIIPYYIEGALADGGMTYGDFKRVPVSGFVDGIKALGDGRVDITLISLGSAGGRKVNEELKSRGGFRYVSLDASPKAFANFENKLPSGSIISLKANPKLPGLLEPTTNIVAIPWVMVTNKNTPDKLVYTVVKTLLAHYPELASTFAAFRNSGPKDFAPKHKIPYHPGALKAIEEAHIPH
jgi:uncharacterized protein